MHPDEIRDEEEGAVLNIETGDVTPAWSPVRCGYYREGELGGEDFICAQHLGEFLGVTEDRVQRLGLVRDDFFDVWSVEEFEERNFSVTRDDKACKRNWFGRCLWPMGYVVLWLPNTLELERLLEGAPIEGAMNGEHPLKVWMP